MRPNFIYIGTGKAGSTWLFEVLRHHPQVYVTPVKETNFFDLNFQRGVAWYESFFADADTAVIGEITHRYIRDAAVAERMRDTLGPVKCMVVFRKPEDFALGWYLFARRNGRFTGTSDEWMRSRFEPESVRYFSLLKPFIDAMGRHNIYIACFDELRADPQVFYDGICDFLGVARQNLSAVARAPRNAAERPRSSAVAWAVNRTAKFLKRRGGQRLIAAVKDQPAILAMLYAPIAGAEKPHLSSAALSTIRAIAEPEIRQLDAQCGTTMWQRWYAHASADAA